MPRLDEIMCALPLAHESKGGAQLLGSTSALPASDMVLRLMHVSLQILPVLHDKPFGLFWLADLACGCCHVAVQHPSHDWAMTSPAMSFAVCD